LFSQVQHIIVMGVAGSGKSTLAKLLSATLGWPMDDGDSFHPKSNIDKMRAGTPIDEADRMPWLEALAERLHSRDRSGQCSILACSSLKRAHRDQLRASAHNVRFVHLIGNRALLAERLLARTDHFFPASLLASQVAALEPLAADEEGIVIDASKSVEQQLRESIFKLGLAQE
jgi:carbohydrate kinase (thermoresistant glucokinase family)